MLHLCKLAVGVADLADFDRRIQAQIAQARERGQLLATRHITRHKPKRAGEILSGGSLYWIVKGAIRARQRVLAIETLDQPDRVGCALLLEGALVRTRPVPHRPFQGWRYLLPEHTPEDSVEDDPSMILPETMFVELKDLGLL